MRWLLAAAALLAVGLGTFGLRPDRAAACNYGASSLEDMATYSAVIVVGEVVSERKLNDTYDSYESTIEVAAVLKGSAGSEIRIFLTGWLGPGCEGNPRLLDGERVLLFLQDYQGHDIAARPSPTPGPLQVAGYENGKWVLDKGEASSVWGTPTGLSAEQAVRRTASIAGSTPGQRDAALLFAVPSLGHPTELPEDHFLSGGPLPPLGPEDTSSWTVGPLIVLAVVLLGTIVLAGTMLARRRRAH